ncbi:MAG: PAS domain S-box protein [Candidatus Latescibacterota bacterium]
MKERRQPGSPYEALFAASLDAVLLTAPDGRILDANGAACRLLGRPREELLRLGRAAVVDPGDPRLEAELAERDRTGAFRGELRFRRGDGSTFLGEVATAVYADADRSLRTSMVIRDVTPARQATEVLQASARFNQDVLDSLTAHVCVLTANGAILAVNRAWRVFAAANPPMAGQTEIGANYFGVCEQARGEDAAAARQALHGLQAVVRDEVPASPGAAGCAPIWNCHPPRGRYRGRPSWRSFGCCKRPWSTCTGTPAARRSRSASSTPRRRSGWRCATAAAAWR